MVYLIVAGHTPKTWWFIVIFLIEIGHSRVSLIFILSVWKWAVSRKSSCQWRMMNLSNRLTSYLHKIWINTQNVSNLKSSLQIPTNIKHRFSCGGFARDQSYPDISSLYPIIFLLNQNISPYIYIYIEKTLDKFLGDSLTTHHFLITYPLNFIRGRYNSARSWFRYAFFILPKSAKFIGEVTTFYFAFQGGISWKNPLISSQYIPILYVCCCLTAIISRWKNPWPASRRSPRHTATASAPLRLTGKIMEPKPWVNRELK